ncbi:AAA family ATPase [Mesorhizobium koreense]|uniref:AAA family ATPase n=1 Tax=Mesorhizobium koreense TaxID=3074855 RepID=UPI00287B68ED|nr:AAA family ATPase [Mesorhizobium sp. WR6]
MSDLIFATNFRGFEYVEFDISKNCFFVGDNSSGKTSLLHLASYVSQSDLLGYPVLDDELGIDRDDFFSPFFSYAPVTIGFNHTDDGGGEEITRIITIRLSRGNYISVDRCTFSNGENILSIQRRGRYTYAKLLNSNKKFELQYIKDVHRSTTGFTRVRNDDREQINSQLVAFLILGQISPEFEKSGGSVASMIFRNPLPTSRHIGPVRGMGETYYKFDRRIKPSGSHFASIMQDMSGSIRPKVQELIDNFGRDSGLFDKVIVKRLAKDMHNPPIYVQVVRNGKKFPLNQVGVGVAQVAPILAETLGAVGGLIEGSTFFVQQPELHLHPVAQASLGQYFYNLSQLKLNFLIETHSDFLIDRFRSMIRDGEAPSLSYIYYCYSDRLGNHMHSIKIDNNGKLVDPPDRYGEFFVREISRTMF